MALLQRISKVKAGFTLVEAMVTLAIFISLVVFSCFKLDTYRSQLVLDNTTRSVKSSLEQAARNSAIKHQAISVNYFSARNLLYFRGKTYTAKYHLADGVKLADNLAFTISANGTITPRTIVISNGKNTQKLKIQMTWGRIIEE